MNDAIENGKISVEVKEFYSAVKDGKTGEYVETIYDPIEISKELAKWLKRQGWNFDWSLPVNDGYAVYVLKLLNDDEIQGLIAYKPELGLVDVGLVESAPHNKEGKRYVGVGGHLFAMACEDSFKRGNEGYVIFIAKTKLASYFIKEYGARYFPFSSHIEKTGPLLFFNEVASKKLLNKYIRRKV